MRSLFVRFLVWSCAAHAWNVSKRQLQESPVATASEKLSCPKNVGDRIHTHDTEDKNYPTCDKDTEHGVTCDKDQGGSSCDKCDKSCDSGATCCDSGCGGCCDDGCAGVPPAPSIPPALPLPPFAPPLPPFPPPPPPPPSQPPGGDETDVGLIVGVVAGVLGGLLLCGLVLLLFVRARGVRIRDVLLFTTGDTAASAHAPSIIYLNPETL